jgi:lipoprotein-anchoring transpeptidase ErfK/SrfK
MINAQNKRRSIGINCLFWLFLGLGIFWCHISYAQERRIDYSKPYEKKILKEYKDKKGNTIREMEYMQGRTHIRETLTIPNPFAYTLRVPVNIDTLIKDSVWLVVNKAHYCLQVYYRRKLIRNYKVVFGPKPMENKCMEGDRCTPEGWFMITDKNPKSKYNKFMRLNYPNDSSIARFNDLKEKGKIPKNARMGGDVGIHGVWKNGDDMIETGVNWTDGCIAIKNKDADELYSMVIVGTRVLIRK